MADVRVLVNDIILYRNILADGAPGRMTLFFTTAPFFTMQPRPMTEFSTVPSIRQPLETTEFFTDAVSKYWVGQESLVLV